MALLSKDTLSKGSDCTVVLFFLGQEKKAYNN